MTKEYLVFIGRKDELAFLQEQYNTPQGRLVVLYGRRRIGKTELLREFCKNKEHVFYTSIECIESEQLESFSKQMLATSMEASKFITSFSGWEQAFSSIAAIPSKGKRLVIIDEFPSMAGGDISIMSILQKVWDSTLRQEDVMLVLCGSSMSFMENKVLSEKTPLYGRATGILKMNPMGFYESIQFFPHYSTLDKILAYGILGGIPHYLKQFDDRLPIASNVKKNILQRGSILYSEPEFLLHQSLRETSVYNTIIKAIASGSTRLSKIHDMTQIEKSKLSSYLSNLLELGIIKKEFSFSDGIQQQTNIKRGLYRISDNFFCFWYAFVFPYMSELEGGDMSGIYTHVIEPRLNGFISYVFEDICKEYLRTCNRNGKLPFHFTKIERWWNKSDELDIVASDSDGLFFCCGECKYQDSPMDSHEIGRATRKFIPKKDNAQIYYYFFARSGFTRQAVELAHANGYQLVDLEKIVQMGTEVL